MLKSSIKVANFIRFYTKMYEGLPLNEVVKRLEEFAPLNYAEKWDNVGLLLEPYNQMLIKKILLTIDLTERVAQEAVDKNINMIISYHPPIFKPLKRITQTNWKERIVSMCLAESIALYSPHTAWDNVFGGVNDWLASAFLPCENIKPIQPHADYAELCIGSGRIFTTNTCLQNAIWSIQKHIGQPYVHVAMAADHNLKTKIENVAICAGSGGSLLRDIKADLYISGEMSHHDILDANQSNVSVILCNHSNSERGFLETFRPKLETLLNDGCEVMVSKTDKDPIQTYFKNC